MGTKDASSLLLPGMPDTEVFWNTSNTITIRQTDATGETMMVTVMPEGAEKLARAVLAVRDKMLARR